MLEREDEELGQVKLCNFNEGDEERETLKGEKLWQWRRVFSLCFFFSENAVPHPSALRIYKEQK